jgi:dihydroneopterin aldolase
VVAVSLDLRGPGESDALDDTIDYGVLCAMVERIITTERFTLIERLATRIAEVTLADERVSAVTVSVRKLRPPVPQQLTTSGVRITRSR